MVVKALGVLAQYSGAWAGVHLRASAADYGASRAGLRNGPRGYLGAVGGVGVMNTMIHRKASRWALALLALGLGKCYA